MSVPITQFDEEEIASHVPELRQKFEETYAEAIKAGEYDARDLHRLKEDFDFAKCFIRSFGEKGDIEAPVKNVDSVFRFRKEMGINDLNAASFPKEFEERKVLYWNGVDKGDRKILTFRVARHKKGQQILEMKKFIAWYLEEHHKAHPGARIVLTFDFTGAGVTNMDLDITKFIISCLSNYFPSICGYILLFEMPWLLSSLWKVIRSWLDEEQKKKIIMAKKADIKNYIAEDQLEEHMK